MTKVVHLRKEHWDVRIDRPGPWGNPFPMYGKGGRALAIKLFEQEIRSKPEYIARVKAELKGKILGCWCKPKPCHGDVLARIADEA